jgi:DNA-binding NtrC family response regulator
MNGGRILVIDEDPAYRELCKTTLQGHGYSVQCLASCSRAIRWLRDRAFDLVFMDLNADALHCLRHIAATDQGQRNRVIVMSATSPSFRQLVDARNAGASDFVNKPMNEQALLTLIERTITQKR